MTTNYCQLTAIGLLSLASAPLHAVTLFEDTFNRTGNLAGSTPDIGPSWSTTSINGTVGSGVFNTAGNFLTQVDLGSANFGPNTIFNLSADFNITAGGDFWMGLGYWKTGDSFAASEGTASFFHRHSSVVNPNLTLIGDSFPQNILEPPTYPKNILSRVTVGNSASNATVEWFVNGTQVGNAESIDFSNVAGFKFQVNGATGTVDNLRLTATPVPEPATGLLAVLGLAVFLRHRRR